MGACAETSNLATGRTRPRMHRAASALLGTLGALLPLGAWAAEEGRVLEQPDNFGTVALVTVLGSVGVLLLASLGRLYQKQRGIRWRFQDPDQPHDAAH